MKTIKELQELLDPYYRENLDCDGQFRVMRYVLDQQEIRHKSYVGSIRNTILETGFPNIWMWIELRTKEGPTIIDYKVRKWLGDNESNPHGVFLKSAYPHIKYEGKTSTEKPMKKFVIDILLKQ